MLHVILYAIVPIIVVMLAGFISGKKGIFTGDDAKKFNKVVLDYALPAALFVSIVQASREMLAADLKLSLIALFGIMGCFMIVYFVFLMFKKNTGAEGCLPLRRRLLGCRSLRSYQWLADYRFPRVCGS
ncbi:AEC family transporter [Duncaniella freteri]|uniref:AEC family transporter n=1 Tax=Duncaniella freteri TaxID=2530391 RepID=UPI002570FA83|nr:AEC family transporter [Duncaniella freteri]